MKRTKEFRELSNEDLDKRLKEFKKELMKENVQVASGAASTGKVKQLKKNIARLLTIRRQKEVSFK